MTRSVAGAILAVLIWCEFATGRVTDQSWEFEVASVKPAPPNGVGDTNSRGGPGTSDPGQVTYERTWLRNLVADAYGVRADQITGPDWINTEAYTIAAKIAPDTTRDQFKEMLRNLLAERFHLTLHHEPKTVPVYVLSVAPGGPSLKRASADSTTAAPVTPTCDPRQENRFPTLRPGRLEALQWCPGMAYYHYRKTMAEFAPGLGPLINMSNGDGILRGGPPAPFVVDETGLTDRFEFTLEFAGSIFPSSPAQVAALIASGSLPSDSSPEKLADHPRGGPDLFKALASQLGLKLEKAKMPVDFLVIDHADKVPTRN
ncbi:MAG TPA: TIGR03435 family protein [Candidatus Sulfopaludibacter sp.]|jgi:uncharacterized protein (TIGR03435 family)|nr:TIGR03435 family protein [Candidatus Sulfopaludibacter sp.]